MCNGLHIVNVCSLTHHLTGCLGTWGCFQALYSCCNDWMYHPDGRVCALWVHCASEHVNSWKRFFGLQGCVCDRVSASSCAYVHFYSCLHAHQCLWCNLKVTIVWEGFKRDGCHSLNAPPPSSQLGCSQRPRCSSLNLQLTYLSHFAAIATETNKDCSALCGSSFDRL